MSRERREKKRFQAALGDPAHVPHISHPLDQKCSGFSFDWKPGQKEKFFKNGGAPIESPLNVLRILSGADTTDSGS